MNTIQQPLKTSKLEASTTVQGKAFQISLICSLGKVFGVF